MGDLFFADLTLPDFIVYLAPSALALFSILNFHLAGFFSLPTAL